MEVVQEGGENTISVEATTNFFFEQFVTGTWQIAIVGPTGYEVMDMLRFETDLRTSFCVN